MPQTKLETITGYPADNFSVARCGDLGSGHGVTWKHTAGASLANLSCPQHDRPLIQTTRQWRNFEWVVIPEAQLKKAAQAGRAAKQAKVDAKVAAGTHKYVRDLQVGDVFEKSTNVKTLHAGRVESIEKIAGGKYRVVVSRKFTAVADGAAYWYTDDASEDAAFDRAAQITLEGVAPAGALVYIDKPRNYGTVIDDQLGWAADRPGLAVALCWTNVIRRTEKYLVDESYTRPVVPGVWESKERFEQRKAAEATKAAADKARAERRLKAALARLVRVSPVLLEDVIQTEVLEHQTGKVLAVGTGTSGYDVATELRKELGSYNNNARYTFV